MRPVTAQETRNKDRRGEKYSKIYISYTTAKEEKLSASEAWTAGKTTPTSPHPAITRRLAYLGHPGSALDLPGHPDHLSLFPSARSGTNISPLNFISSVVVISRFSAFAAVMALVVEQTLPYSASALHLEDPKRWSRLFHLIRPSVTVVELSSGEPVVIDTALINSNDVAIAVVGRQGHLSNRVLSHSFAAFAVAQDQESAVRSGEIVELLHERGFNTERGVIVVRTGAKQNLRHVSEQTLEVTLPGELKLDHVLSLLLSSNRETK